MGKDSELIRLEEYVERLLIGFTGLKVENQRLEQELEEQKTENSQLKQALESVDSERTDVCGRVTSLIERLERWESELESEPPDNKAYDSEPDDEEEETLSEEDNGGTVQGSLFSES